MKIKTLRLKNFGPFKDAEIAFDRPVALILGDNATGKTTIATSIEVLLTGRASRFAGYKIGLAALIGSHGNEAEVQALLDTGRGEGTVLRRRIRPSGLSTAVGDHDVTKSAFDFYSPPSMRNPERAWQAVCDVGGVLDRDSADQKALLLDLVDPALPSGSLDGLRWDLTGGVAPTTLDQLEGAYDQAYKARRVSKARLAEIVVAEPERPRADLDAIGKRLKELGERESTLTGQIGEGRGRRTALESERAHLVEVVDRLAVEIGELGTEATAQKAITAAEVAVKAAQDAQEARQKADLQVATTQARVKIIAGLEVALARQGAECETCGTALTKEKRQERAEALKAERGKLELWLKKNAQPVLGNGAAKASRALDDAKRLLARIGDRQLQQAKEAQRLKDFDADLAAGPPSNASVESELVEVRGRISKGQQFNAEAVALNQRWDRHDDAQIKWKKLSEDVVALERLCDALGPKGIGEKILQERFGAVMSKLNRVLARFGLEMGVQADPWALRFAGRPTLLLSGSERWRAGFCLQVAVGSLTGAKLAVVDGADILDQANRAVLMSVAKDAVEKGLVEQIIVTATPADASMLKGWASPFRAYHLTGGVIEVLP